MGRTRIENEQVLLEFDLQSGALVRWVDKQRDWELTPGDAVSFVIYAPHQGDRTHTIDGRHQHATGVQVSEDEVKVHYDELLLGDGQHWPIAVDVSFNVTGTSVRFGLAIENASVHQVDAVLFPHLGELGLPSRAAGASVLVRDYYGALEHKLYPRFEPNQEYFGTIRPTRVTNSLVFGNPTAPFVLLRTEVAGLLAAVQEQSPEIVSWRWELEPGYTDSVLRTALSAHGAVPDSHLVFAATHACALAAGASARLPAVTLTTTGPGVESGLRPYREHRRATLAATHAPAWAREPHSWYQVQLNSPENERRFTFADLPALAAECAQYGIDVLEPIGWNEGGQDRNNPSCTPAPELGGEAALRQAIKECQALGVRVVLFAKFNWADRSTARFRDELHRLAVKDPYGDYYVNPGYQYATPWQFLDINTRRLVPMCYLAEDYLRLCEQEFDKILDSGADGLLYDEAMHHTPALLCFDQEHGHRPGASVYGGDRSLAERLRARVPAERRGGFVLVGENLHEGISDLYDLSYIRSYDRDHQPITRFVNPRTTMLTTVVGSDDRNLLNQCLVYRYLPVFEPRNFKGRPSDVAPTLQYAKVVEQAREEFRDFLWDGTWLGRDAARVATTPDDAGVSAVFEASDGRRLVAFANYELDEVTATVEVPWLGSRGSWRIVGGPGGPLDAPTFRVPARSCLLVVEE